MYERGKKVEGKAYNIFKDEMALKKNIRLSKTKQEKRIKEAEETEGKMERKNIGGNSYLILTWCC